MASLDYAPILLINVRLGWKGLDVTYTLVYNASVLITVVKSITGPAASYEKDVDNIEPSCLAS